MGAATGTDEMEGIKLLDRKIELFYWLENWLNILSAQHPSYFYGEPLEPYALHYGGIYLCVRAAKPPVQSRTEEQAKRNVNHIMRHKPVLGTSATD